MLKNAILIAGPTASGKSARAIAMARECGGVIVNADSMQVYSLLSLLTARPGVEETGAVPHRLYGHVHPGEPYSTGAWLRDVDTLIQAEGLVGEGRPAIFVGGTGLYFRALTEGLAPMPDIPPAVRERWRQRLVEEGLEALHRLLRERDPAAAQRIDVEDGQRVVRALEVHEASGRPISAWQAERSLPLVDSDSAQKLVLEPDRAMLAERIGTRFDRMLEEGVLDEVRALQQLDLPPEMPAMKAIGVRELSDYLGGRCSLEDAASRAKAATRQYAKRQMTWFRHQLGADWRRVPC